MTLRTAIILLLVVVTVSAGSIQTYELGIIGGGAAGVSSTYYIDLMRRYGSTLGVGTVPSFLRSGFGTVIMFEERSVLGGNIRASQVGDTSIDLAHTASANIKYGLNGKYLVDTGAQRIPQLTTPYDRAFSVLTNTTVEVTPYKTYQQTRGRRLECPDPNYLLNSPSDPWGMTSSCGSDGKFVGIANQNDNGIGPAFFLDKLQNWAKHDPLSAIWEYMIYDSPNPLTCSTPLSHCSTVINSPCECFSLAKLRYSSIKAAMIGLMGHEAFEAFEFDFAGFYVDFEAYLVDPNSYTDPYLVREYDTNAVYGYVVNSSYSYILNMAKPFLQQGGKLITGTKVVRIEYSTASNPSNGFILTTNKGTVYKVKRLIVAVEPDQFNKNLIKGKVADDLRASPLITSAYCVPVYSVMVELKPEDAFWVNHSLIPQADGKGVYKWALLRSFGDGGHLSRTEIRYTPSGAASVMFRASYTDYISQSTHDGYKYAPQLNDRYWQLLKTDLAYTFQIDSSLITNNYQKITVEYFSSGWCYINGSNPASLNAQRDYAAAPLGNNVPLVWAHNAWDEEFLGWKEAAFRSAARAMNRFMPGTVEMIDCLAHQLFPECDSSSSYSQDWTAAYPNIDDLNCYSWDYTHITGTQTITPSIYCTERYWFNDFNKTSGCIALPTIKQCDLHLMAKEKMKASMLNEERVGHRKL